MSGLSCPPAIFTRGSLKPPSNLLNSDLVLSGLKLNKEEEPTDA